MPGTLGELYRGRHLTTDENNKKTVSIDTAMERISDARTSGHLNLERCFLDKTAIEAVVDCLESGTIHTLNLAFCRWHQPDNTTHEESSALFTACFRNAKVSTNLRILDLSNLSSSDTIVAILHNLLECEQSDSSLIGLRQLHLGGTGLAGEAAGEALAAVIRDCPRLQVLDLSNSRKLGPMGMRALAWGLFKYSDKSSLRHVNVSACLRDEDAAMMIYALARLTCLESLDLMRNPLGVSSRTALTHLLETTRTLRTLKFGYFGGLLASGNAQPFAKSFAESALKKLDLSLYLAHPKSMRHVLAALPNSRSLQVLVLDGAAMPLLTNVLPQFSSLHTLDVRGKFDWTSNLENAFLKNYSLHQDIAVDDEFPHKGKLKAVVKRNRALRTWQTADQKERAVLFTLWPQLLAQCSSDSVVGLSCFLGLLRRGVVESS